MKIRKCSFRDLHERRMKRLSHVNSDAVRLTRIGGVRQNAGAADAGGEEIW